MRMKKLVSALVIGLLVTHSALSQEPVEPDMSVRMMESTCKLVGANGSSGSGFIIARPVRKFPGKVILTLITADHVLAGAGESATMTFRRLKGSNEFERFDVPLQLRENGKPAWSKHPEVDLAALDVVLPPRTIRYMITPKQLADDGLIETYDILPGRELLCLGYPFGAESNTNGCFAILRSGKISSYPILPTKKTKTFLFDFSVFPGNSGGPVYVHQVSPTKSGSVQLGVTIQGIVGVVIQERKVSQRVNQLYERREIDTPLRLGEVIHATFIRELLDSMAQP
jgi:S1-C subfamily serine protease